MSPNPFYLKDRWVWRRENPPFSLTGSRFAIVGSMAAPIALVWVLDAFNLVGMVAQTAWALSAATWLAVVSMLAISTGLQVYTRERDLGALEIAALTPTSPWREVSGRLRGAFVPIFEAWLLGFAYVASSLLIDNEFKNVAAPLWVFSLLWFSSLTTVAMYWSARSRSSNQALGNLMASLVALNAAYLVACVNAPPSLASALPLNPMVFLRIAELAVPAHPCDVDLCGRGVVHVWYQVLLIWAPLWLAFQLAVRAATARLIADAVPLRLGRAPQGPSGLVPTASPNLAVQPTGRPSPPLDHGLTDRLLRPFDGNPFYHAYRKGFMRVFSGVTAAPGSVVAAAFSILGPLLYRVFFTEDAIGSWILIVAVILASLIGACEGLVLGARALSTERDQATWPMLVVSGIRPETLLRGKFATAFYALSGEWAIGVPFWLLAAVGSHPLVALLALVQPMTIALGILLGLWMASQPRYLVISLDKAGLAVAGLLGGMWLLKGCAPGAQALANLFKALNPVGMTVNLASQDTMVGVAQFALQACLAMGAAAVLWLHSSSRLSKVLRGE